MKPVDENRNIRLVVQYDGTSYHGWQRQKDLPTIQEELENSIATMAGEPVAVIGSGRTDAGVHALHQVCNFIIRSDIAPGSFKRGLNSLLPQDIRVKEADYCPLHFHARYDVSSKTYEYRILNQHDPNVFLRAYAWHIQRPLNLEEMKRCLGILLGRHDFSSFRSTGSGNFNPVRDMMRAEFHEAGPHIYCIHFEADGFLRHMVRNMVGTLVEVGLGQMDLSGFIRVFESRDRRQAGVKAPPQGLYLTMVRYG